jgi:DNA polymerase-3 subunit epsilon
MNFIALDFETANWYRKSACSIGMVKVENGIIVDEFYSLIKPTPNWFHSINTNIHGLSEEQCSNAPTFGELWPNIQEWIQNKIIVGHNVSFERSVLNHLFDEYQIGSNISEYLCSLYLARVAYPNLNSYKLPNVYYNVFNKAFGEHHHALEDARASAEIVIEVVKNWNPPTFQGMIGALYEESVKSRTNPKREVSLALLTPDEGFEANEKFKGKVFVFTGEQSCFTKEEAAQFVVNNGGKANDNVTKSTTTVVIGHYNQRYGQDHKSNKVKKAEELISDGQNITFLSESEFLQLTKA